MHDHMRHSGLKKLPVLLSAVLLMNASCPADVYADTIDMINICAGEARVIQSEYAPSFDEDTMLQATILSPASANVIIKIDSADDFAELAANSKVEDYTKDKTFVLTKDIDLSGYSGISVPAFFGTFDGKNHQISGLSYEKDEYSSGLFRYVKQGAVIRNLIVNASVTVSDNSLINGGICGVNEGVISDCVFDGKLKGRNITGGIAAINEVPGTIMACENRAAVTGYYFTGGICGKNYGVVAYSDNQGPVNNTIEWVEESDKVDPTADKFSVILSGGYHLDSEETFKKIKGTDTGGLAGYSAGAVFQSKNSGEIGYEHTGYNVGGIVGRQAGFISFCENSGNVYGRKDIGGIVGQMEPYLTLEDLETLPEAVDKLHDLVQTSLDDAHASSDLVSADMKNLSAFTKNAVQAGDALTTTGKDYLNRVGDAADSLQARVDYLSDALPGILEDLDEATDNFSDTAKSIKNLLDDSNVVDRLSPEEKQELEDAMEELKDRRLKNLPDRFDAVKDILTVVVPESVEAASDTKKDAKKLYNRMGELSDSIDDSIDHATEVIEHVNGMPKPTVPRLGSEFDFERELLRVNLDAMTDTLSALADHSGNTSDVLTEDLCNVNDQVNVVFHIISDELDRLGDITRGETDELVRDVSDEDIEAIELGRVDNCANKGSVKGDIDIGGIAGSMFTDSEDPEENAAGNLEGGFSDKYMLRNVILKCKNDSLIESKKDGAGGIVGYMGNGIVSDCESFGPVTSTGGSYAGGIAGQSFSIIRNSSAMAYLDAASYVGGIAGFGTTITGCSAIPVFESSVNRSGSIAGQIDAEKDTHMQHLEVISGNRYVNENVAGIDNMSMAGVAEPVTYQKMVSDSSASPGFKNVLIVFITDDPEEEETEIVGTVRLPYGTPLSTVPFPDVPDIEEEEYVQWPVFSDGEILTAPLPVKGEISYVQKTLKSEELYPETEYPLAYVSGNFTRKDSLSAEVSIPDEQTVEYTVEISGDRAGNVQTVRLYCPFEKYELYGVDEGGEEHRLLSEKKGSYAEYKGAPEYAGFKLKDNKLLNRIRAFFGK